VKLGQRGSRLRVMQAANKLAMIDGKTNGKCLKQAYFFKKEKGVYEAKYLMKTTFKTSLVLVAFLFVGNALQAANSSSLGSESSFPVLDELIEKVVAKRKEIEEQFSEMCFELKFALMKAYPQQTNLETAEQALTPIETYKRIVWLGAVVNEQTRRHLSLCRKRSPAEKEARAEQDSMLADLWRSLHQHELHKERLLLQLFTACKALKDEDLIKLDLDAKVLRSALINIQRVKITSVVTKLADRITATKTAACTPDSEE